jgi:hypothetical protein
MKTKYLSALILVAAAILACKKDPEPTNNSTCRFSSIDSY